VLASVSATALRTLGPAPDAAVVTRFLSNSSELDDDIVTAVVRADGQVTRAPGVAVVEVGSRDVDVAAGRSASTTHLAGTGTGASYRVHVVPIGERPGLALFVARPMAGAQQILQALTLALTLFGLLAVVAAGIVGRRVARAGVAPVRELRAAVEQRAAQDDLQPPGDRVLIMREVRNQLMEFSTLVSDLIGLTREDRSRNQLEKVDLTAVLEEAVDRVSMRAPGLAWAVQLDEVRLQGDADLLARAFTDVLDNAVTYSPPSGTIGDADRRRGADQRRGPGRQRGGPALRVRGFSRSEASRATPGTGLGLSITDSVVRQHGGTVAVTDAPGGGASFVLTFPGATARTNASR